MNFRNLRIAWSVFWGMVAILLIMLWVRSYWRLEILEKQIGRQAIQISSVKGCIAIAHLNRPTIIRPYLNVVAGDAADWRKGRVLGFAYYADSFVTAIIAPHWLPALLSAAFAFTPWIASHCRFSLRTMLIASTIVAVVLGLAVMMLRGR
jgi:hypothetical protein